jgi:uncharacterized protein
MREGYPLPPAGEGLARIRAASDDAPMPVVCTPGPWSSMLGICLALGAVAVAQEPPMPTPKAQDPAPAAPNRLARSASPYLRQHQRNPVDWYPWGDEALQKAKDLGKPIFLSIGYSACHWCHVMAAESFADPEIAAVMNELFVCIKVDREERPDVDEIYLAAVQAMGQQGGWPLSVWLTPDGKPFYGGTYFPPVDSRGRPGFRRVCEQLGAAWRDRRDEVLKGASELTAHLQEVLAPTSQPGEPTRELLAKLRPQAEERFDREHFGLAQPPAYAPKFPSALELQALLGLPDDAALAIVVPSLRAMANGGIHDQLGFGFHRYSTDRQWLVPHFEKMLYDNVLLAQVYLTAAARTKDATLAATAARTLDYVLRELRDPRGGFWSSQDAQSEDVEGKFFVWSEAEVKAVLGDEAPPVLRHFGISADGNWEHTNVLSVVVPVATLAKELDQPAAAVQARIDAAVGKLLAVRGRRVRPATDDKVLAAWNGMALRAFAHGYRQLGDERYRQAAVEAAGFLLDAMVKDGRLARAWLGGTAQHQGCIEDYGALADGLLAVFEIDPDPRWLAGARTLLQAAVRFFGADDGGFWFTASDHETLVARTKSAVCGATASGTALITLALLRGGLLLGDEALYERGVAALRANHGLLAAAPAAAPGLVAALQFHLAEPREIVIAGAPGDPRTQALLRAAWTMPGAAVMGCVHDGNRTALEALSPVFVDKRPVDGAPAAYVCRRGACEAPITDPARLEAGR